MCFQGLPAVAQSHNSIRPKPCKPIGKELAATAHMTMALAKSAGPRSSGSDTVQLPALQCPGIAPRPLSCLSCRRSCTWAFRPHMDHVHCPQGRGDKEPPCSPRAGCRQQTALRPLCATLATQSRKPPAGQAAAQAAHPRRRATPGGARPQPPAGRRWRRWWRGAAARWRTRTPPSRSTAPCSTPPPLQSAPSPAAPVAPAGIQ